MYKQQSCSQSQASLHTGHPNQHHILSSAQQTETVTTLTKVISILYDQCKLQDRSTSPMHLQIQLLLVKLLLISFNLQALCYFKKGIHYIFRAQKQVLPKRSPITIKHAKVLTNFNHNYNARSKVSMHCLSL